MAYVVILVLFTIVAVVNAQDCPSDVIIVIDASGSVTDEYDKHLVYAKQLVNKLDIGPKSQRVAVVLYSSRATVRFDFDRYKTKDEIIQAINGLPHLRGTTTTKQALSKARELLKTKRRKNVPVNVVVLHDGFSMHSAIPEAESLRSQRDVRVYAVGIVEPLWKEELERIANRPDLVFYGMNSVNALVRTMLLGCAPEPPTTTAPTTTTTRRTTTTTFGGCLIDLLFVMDASGSVHDTWDKELRIAADFVDLLKLGPRNARVGLVRFASARKHKTIFSLGDIDNKDEIKSRILTLPYTSGTTDIAGALQLAEQEMAERKGRRSDATAIVVLFTDGYSYSDPQPAAARLRSRGVTIYAVGFRNGLINRPELEGIVGADGRLFTEEDLTALRQEYKRITASC